MKTILCIFFVNMVLTVHFRLSNGLFFLNSTKIKNSIFFLGNSKTPNLPSDSGPLLTPEDMKNIDNFVNDLKSGTYGHKSKEEIESLKPEVNKTDVEDVKELLKFKNEKLEKTMSDVFNLSDLPAEDGKDFNWDEFEKKINEQGRKEGMNVEELRSMVHSIFRKKGLLKENFKVLEVSGLKLNWRQSLANMEIWFTVDSTAKRSDYEIKFLPSTLTIEIKGTVVLEQDLFGKVDCDGCFWTMYKNPSTGSKYININLTKRSPNFNNMWDRPFK